MTEDRRRKLRLEQLEPRALLAATQIIGNTMQVTGTAEADTFAFVWDAGRAVRVNGTNYTVPSWVNRVIFDGAGGNDNITAWISGSAELSPGSGRLFAGPREVTVAGVEKIVVHGGAGQSVRFVDSPSSDTFVDRQDYSRMFGADYNNVAHGFASVTAMSSGDAGDVGWFYNLAGAHVFSGRENSSRSFNSAHQATAFGFARAYARAEAGDGDLAEMHGGAGDDNFTARPGESSMAGTGYQYVAMGFDKVVGRGGPAGEDRADLFDSPDDDTLTSWPVFTRLEGAGYSVEAKAFDIVHAHAVAGGHDAAWLNDGALDDLFESTPESSSIEGNGVRNIASGFDMVVSRSTHGGNDEALFTDSAGADEFSWKDSLARLTGSGFDNRALGYARVQVNATQGGMDKAWFQAAAGDMYSGTGPGGRLTGINRLVSHTGVENVNVAWPGPHHPTPSMQSATYTLTTSDQSSPTEVMLGSGVVHPWRVLTMPDDPTRVLVLTGEGEQGGASFLYVLDVQTLVPIGTPLSVGASASDIAWVGDNLVVTARNSAEIFLIDVDNWKVLDRVSVMQEPIAVTAIGSDRFAIVSIRSRDLHTYRIAAGKLAIDRKGTLPGIAYDVTFDAARNKLLVSQPAIHAVLEIDVPSWTIVRQHVVGGEPSYGGVMMGRYFITTDRDGFVHFIDRTTSTLHKLDLAAALGLDPNQVGVRGIDPTDLIVLDNEHLVVVNNRQDSLLLHFDSAVAFQAPTVVTRFLGGNFGAGVMPVPDMAFGISLSNYEILITSPSINRIDRITFTTTSNGSNPEQVAAIVQTNVVGVSPMAAVRIGSGAGATLGVLTSDHRLHLISEFTGSAKTFTTVGSYVVRAWHPIAADDEGRLWLVVNSTSGRRLIAVSADGTLLHDFASDLASPFSLDAAHGDVVVVDRTNQRIQHVDVSTGVSQSISLPNERPRHAEILGPDEWLVIHDTNPHLGVTHYRNGQRVFQPYTGGRWLAGLTLDGRGRPVMLDFNGTLLEFDVATRAFRTLAKLPIDPAMTLSYVDGQLFAVSPADSAIAVLREDSPGIVTLWSDTRAFDVVPGEGGIWLVTDGGLRWRADYSNASWWR